MVGCTSIKSFLIVFAGFVGGICGKYVEGEINTWENWAFIARFCFQSENGQFEYYIEYDESQGAPNLLLYYDADDQWPAVYKSNKNCHAREAMLKPEQNQILNLSIKYPYREIAGCVAVPTAPRPTQSQAPSTVATPGKKYTLVLPTFASGGGFKRRKQNGTTTTTATATVAFSATSDSFTTIAMESGDYSTDWFSATSEATFSAATEGADDSTIDYFSSTKMDYLTSDVTTTESLSENLGVEAPLKRRKKRALRDGVQRPRRKVVCRNARRFRTARERWWFIAVSNCHGSRGIHIKYKLLMTNGDPGDYWHEHFSADEFYVLPVLMAFTVAYSFTFLAIVICSIELKSRQLLHTTYKLFVYSVLMQFLGILLKSMAYLKYAVNGYGAPSLKVTGDMFMGMSETSFLLLLLLLAKGYTVTRGRLPLSAGVKVTIFMCLYIVTYVSLFIYEAKVFDPGEVLYTYESPAGYGLIILRITAWCMFIYSTVFTLKHYPEKSNFYYPFNVLGTLWFIAGPAFIISANTYIDKWVRESVVCAVLLFITFGGHIMFLLLTMPSVANKNFPYHVRTTQIGAMERAGDVLGINTIEQFGHHAYEPAPSTRTPIEAQPPNGMIVPLSRRTEELFGGLYSQHIRRSANSNGAPASLLPEDDPQGLRATPYRDAMMENVLSWSLAKNLNPQTISNGQLARDRLTSLASIQNDFVSTNKAEEAVEEERDAEGTGVDEWIREVPVQLFTISKSITSSNDKNNYNKVNGLSNGNALEEHSSQNKEY